MISFYARKKLKDEIYSIELDVYKFVDACSFQPM